MEHRPTRRRRRRLVTAQPPEDGRLALTVPQVAYLLNCHPNHVSNLIRSGALPSFLLGRKRLIARSAVEELIASGGTREAG